MSSKPTINRTRKAARAPGEPPAAQDSLSWSERLAETNWTPWLILALAAFLRIFLIEIKPPHFDEGINGWFVDQMTKTGFYRYDPTNYHGPLHFYVLFLAQTLFGRSVWVLRMPVVLASIACIWVTLRFEPLVGRTAARLAALAMAVSTGFVFYGRYSIHEVWMVLFSMLFILGGLGLWQRGTTRYLWCVGLGVAGMILTKETYIIHLGCAALAVFVAWLSHKITPAEEAQRAAQTWTYDELIAVVAVSGAAIVLLYSGTFLNWPGLKGLYLTFSTWFATGSSGNGHEKPMWYWLMLIGRYEPAVALGLGACVLCQMFRSIHVRYLAIYGGGTLMAYSIVHYKTPWCIISFVWPLLFLFGAAFVLVPEKLRGFGAALAGVILAVSLALSLRLNYFRCTTDTEPYVYVQTYNDIFKLTDPLLEMARRDPLTYQLTGHIIRTSAYPLPWMLGEFTKIGYYEKDNLPTPLDGAFLVVQEDRIEEIEAKLKGSYYTMPFTIRNYQDTSKLYLGAKEFRDFFKGRVPDFNGPRTAPAP